MLWVRARVRARVRVRVSVRVRLTLALVHGERPRELERRRDAHERAARPRLEEVLE